MAVQGFCPSPTASLLSPDGSFKVNQLGLHDPPQEGLDGGPPRLGVTRPLGPPMEQALLNQVFHLQVRVATPGGQEVPDHMTYDVDLPLGKVLSLPGKSG